MKYFILFLISIPIMEVVAAIIRSRKKWGTKPFQSSGCNLIPEGNWGECCVDHDKRYREGGWFLARLRADWELMLCMFQNGNPFIAILAFIGERVLGMWYFQWGKERSIWYEDLNQK